MITEVITQNWDYLLWGNTTYGQPGGLLLTLFISITAGALATILGLLGGIILTLGNPILRNLLHSVTTVLRAIPVLMLIFWTYFLLPILLGIDLPSIVTVIAALTLISSAYLSQSVYAGIQAIKKDQWNASLALGLSKKQTLYLVILPQAVRMMLPSLINQWITLIKDSSLAYIVGVAELTFIANQISNREQVYALEIFSLLAFIYFVLCAGLEYIGYRAQSRFMPLSSRRIS